MSALDIFAWIILVVLVLSTVAVFLGIVPVQAQVSAIEAQLKFQQLRLDEMIQLQGRGTGRKVLLRQVAITNYVNPF